MFFVSIKLFKTKKNLKFDQLVVYRNDSIEMNKAIYWLKHDDKLNIPGDSNRPDVKVEKTV